MSFGPARLYHQSCRAGKVFRDEAEFNQHIEQGWVDFPSKIGTGVIAAETHVVAAPAPIHDIQPDPASSTLEVKPKRPGRRSKKSQGGK